MDAGNPKMTKAAIITKYHGATNYRGSRITASAKSDMAKNALKCSVPYPHGLNGPEAFRVAADALCAKLGWTGDLIAGGLAEGYVFVFAPESK